MNYSQNLAHNTVKIFEEPDIQQDPAEGFIRIIPLGGLGEIGKNMMILESREDLIIVDAGLMFPTEEMPGIDYVIPDIRYLLYKKEKLRAIVLTHGHEDHIGGIPYIIEQLDVPVYGTRLTLEILRGKLKEFNLPHQERLIPVEPGDTVKKGAFTVQFFRVIHSISESTGLIIDTPAGTLIHSGDFKFDSSPIDGKLADLSALSSLADKGIRLLMADSTYAERPGFSVPEAEVGKDT